VFVVLACFSCNLREKAGRENGDEFYDIRGLVLNQLANMDSIRPSLKKSAVIDNETAASTFTPDSAAWVKEFEVLLQTDLSQSDLQLSFDLTTEKSADGMVQCYISREPDITHLDTLKLSFEEGAAVPCEIEGHFHAENTLYKAYKHIDFQFQDMDGSCLLARYRIEGWQHMIAKDTNRFEISGEIIY